MPKSRWFCLRRVPCDLSLVALLFISICQLSPAQAAPEIPFYSRANSFGILAAYSDDSSHILLGLAENRKLLQIGVSYSRRLFIDRMVNWQYDGELLPVALDSDPVENLTSTVTFTNPPMTTTSTTSFPTSTACQPSSGSGTFPDGSGSYTYTANCGRRWVVGEGMSPIGFQWNFMPRRKQQPFLVGHGGYMYSTQPIPVVDSGSFNFTFDFGVGVELYRSHSRSLRVEYRYHHISNHNTAEINPGIDNGLFQASYVFGR